MTAAPLPLSSSKSAESWDEGYFAGGSVPSDFEPLGEGWGIS